jgi:hypothetical protein
MPEFAPKVKRTRPRAYFKPAPCIRPLTVTLPQQNGARHVRDIMVHLTTDGLWRRENRSSVVGLRKIRVKGRDLPSPPA